MGEASQERQATNDEVAAMKAIVREGIEAGAVGVSFDAISVISTGMAGWRRPTLRRTLRSLPWRVWWTKWGVGSSNLAATESLVHELPRPAGARSSTATSPSRLSPPTDGGQLTQAENMMRQGHRAYQFVMPRPGDLRYTLKTAQHFDALPTWKS